MLISISGAQGSGKTTVLNKIAELGYPIVDRKTSRSILIDWNVTLDEVYGDRELNMKFQDELLKRKELDEAEAIWSDKLWFTERSYADVFAYTVILLGWKNIDNNWINQYYSKCQGLMSSYKSIYYIKPFTSISVEDDGVRGINPHYTRLVNDTIWNTLKQMEIDPVTFQQRFRLHVIEHNSVNDRVATIVRSAHDLWLDKILPTGK